MRSVRTIALVTPNTDTFTNPTLTTLFQLLLEKGINILIFGPLQQPSCPEYLSNVRLFESHFRLSLFRNPRKYVSQFYSYYQAFQQIRRNEVDTVLSVDPLGLIIGGRLKKVLGGWIHLSYLSFEIFFQDELSGYYLRLKKKEIRYSRLIDSLLIQDEKRKELLLVENKFSLPLNRIFLVPVSPMKIKMPIKSDIHKLLSIPHDKMLAVYSGSVGRWCGTEAIIQAFDQGFWDWRYWLVFHTRKPLAPSDDYFGDLTRLHDDPQMPFKLHPQPFDDFVDLATFLSGFDLALALYFPNSENPYYGRNLMEIGLSSGKFSTYMMLGLPTVVTSCAIYKELLSGFPFGAVINGPDELTVVMSRIPLSGQGATDVYNERLDPTVGMDKYVDAIASAFDI